MYSQFTPPASAGIQATMKGHPIEVLVAYGKYEVLEGNPIEGIVIAKFPTVRQRRIGIMARHTKVSPNIVKKVRFTKA